MPMPVAIPTFDAPEKYEQYALNVEGHAPEKAQEARRRAVKLRATRDGAKSDVERECLEAIYAYEWTLFKKHGKRQRASYTWRMVDERGIIPAVEHAVTRPKETAGYRGLKAEGMLDMDRIPLGRYNWYRRIPSSSHILDAFGILFGHVLAQNHAR